MTRIAVAVLAVCVAVSSACSGQPEPTAGPGAGPPGSTIPARPTPLLAAAATAVPTPGEQPFVLYWFRDCPPPEKATDVSSCRLVTGAERATTDADPADAIVRALLAGPDDVEQANGLTTNIRGITIYDGVTRDGDTVVVHFNRYFETAKTRPQVAQVVFALTQLPEVRRVQILVDNTTNGAVGATPQTRADVSEFLGPLFVDRPAPASSVGHAFDVRGTASVGAATAVSYRFEQSDGTPIGTAHATGAVLGATGPRAPVLVPVAVPTDVTGPVTLVVFRVGTDGLPTDEQRVPLVVR